MSAVRDARMLQQAANLTQAGRLVEAVEACGKLLKLNPNHFDACMMQAMLHARTGKLDGAIDMFRRASGLRPDHVDARYNLAVALNLSGEHAQALEQYEALLKIDARHVNALNNAANTLKTLGRDEDALEKYKRILQINPNQPQARHNIAVTLHALGRHEEALAASQFALALRPEDADSWFNQANVLLDLDRATEALASYDKAISLRPGFAEAHSNRGNALLKLHCKEEALSSYDRAIALKPDHAEAHIKRGAALLDSGRAEDALASYDTAIALRPELALAHSKRGEALVALRRFEDAVASLGAALDLKPDFAEAHNYLGLALAALGEFNEALVSYDKSIALDPNLSQPHANKGNALREMKRFEEAVACFDEARRIEPSGDYIVGDAFVSRLHDCDWSDYAGRVAAIEAQIEQGNPAATPFLTLLISDSRAIQQRAASLHAQRHAPFAATLPAWLPHDRIRLGYFSADFHEHATVALIAGVFEHHDRARFELFAFSFGPAATDLARGRVESAFDHFIDAGAMSDADIAQLARKHEIDVAIDLKGYTRDERAGVFARRAAPVQINYLGYPGTLGAGFIDYILADATIIPEAHRPDYAEKIVCLPHSYQPNDRARNISGRVFTRDECGLPNGAFVFCCFNNAFKIAPATFESWASILGRVEGSVLWLYSNAPRAQANLRKAAEARGLDPARLVFAAHLPVAEHLARHRLADLCLDTLPYNAHTTASDALWMGVPVLTQIGETFAGRVAASLLGAIGLPELITATSEEFEATAVALARDVEKLSSVRQTLAANRLTAPLFDTVRYTKYFEAAIITMHERSLAGQPPDHISIDP